MQITISGKQVELSDPLREHVSTHLAAMTGKYFDHAMEARVTFSRERGHFVCEIEMHAGRGFRLRGEADNPDAYLALNAAAAHVAKGLRRYRRRMNEHSRDSANRVRPRLADAAEDASANP